jgi:alpha-D-xyloside xylohydrolase
MEAGKKVPVKLEWIPDGAESYVSMEYLTPYDEEKQQQLTLYSEAGKSIDYYFIKGNNADDVVAGYRQVTGKSPIVPNWAMGLWQSR